jgi:hypothetical protein
MMSSSSSSGGGELGKVLFPSPKKLFRLGLIYAGEKPTKSLMVVVDSVSFSPFD